MLRRDESERKRVGTLLIEQGLITEEQLAEGLRVQQEKGGRIVEVLVRLGYLSTKDFTHFAARQGSPALSLDNFDISHDILELVPADIALKHRIVPIDKLGTHLTIAMEYALDASAIEEISRATGLKVRPVVCSLTDVENALARYYRNGEAIPGAVPPPPVFEALGAEPSQAESAPVLAEATPKGEAPEGHAGQQPGPKTQIPNVLHSPLKLQGVASLIREISSLPTLPDTVTRVRAAADDPDKGTRDIAEIIATDPPIAAKVLSTINSAAYGLPKKVEDISLAVSLLGPEETCSIAYSVAVIAAFTGEDREVYRRFWASSLRCARICRMIAQARKMKNAPGLFAAGLLHDIGKLALRQVAPERVRLLSHDLVGRALLAEEERGLGLTHAEAGYLLAEHWSLPPDIVEAIRLHHQPAQAQIAPETVALVGVADVLASADSILIQECAGALEVLGSKRALISEVLRAGLSLFEENKPRASVPEAPAE